jgi:NitT/TauT family transport system substrate-binding protein
MLGRASRFAGQARTRRPFRITAAVLSTAGILAAVAGCGVLGGDSGGNTGGSDKVERVQIKVGAMPIIDSAPVHLASQLGYFKEEGLEVQLETVTGAATAIPKLLSGELQFTYGAYVPVFQAQEKGTGDFKFVADSYQTAEKIFVIMVGPNSTVKSPKDLAGKTIATNTKNSITDLLAKSAMDTAGVDISRVNWVEFPFPDMQARLASGQVDAAVMLEPFVTQAERAIGALPILDTSQGPTQNFPISGHAATAQFVKDHPKTTEAFRRALTRASEAARDRKTVEDAVVKYAKIDPQVAQLVKIGTYPTSLDRTRLQRTVDLMTKYKLLTKEMNVDAMIFSPLVAK